MEGKEPGYSFAMRIVSTVSEPRRAECALPVVSQMYESHVTEVI